MFNGILIWIMRFVLLGMIYVFLYKVIRVMYNDLKGNRSNSKLSAGIEVVKINRDIPVNLGTVYPLHPMTTIGRLDDNSIIIDNQFISGHHARIYLKNNYYILKDMDSTNGTFLNDEKIEKPMVIKNDDLIGIGGIVFKVIG